jgi:pilus assembly protein CpaB
MRSPIVLVVLIALALAGGTAVLVRTYLSQAATPADDGPQAAQVLVAAQDLPAGTLLNSNHWRWQAWPDGSVDRAYIVRPRTGDKAGIDGQLSGAAVKRAIGAGEPITASKVVKPGEAGFLAGALSPGMRALGIKVTAVSSASGFILPGDRVDVVLTQQLRDRGRNDARLKTVSETVLRNIRVLTIDQSADDVDKKAKVGKTATLEVTPKQTEILSTAATIGNLSLALRSLARREGEDAGRGVTADHDVSSAFEAEPAAPPAQPVAAKPARARRTVEMYLGDKFNAFQVPAGE